MGYKLAIDTPGISTVFSFETAEEARNKAEECISQGFCEIPVKGVVLMTGPGTIYKHMSDEDAAETAEREAGTIPFDQLGVFLVIIQMRGVQLEPFSFNTADDWKVAVHEAARCGVFRNAYLGVCNYVHLAPGSVLVGMEKETFVKQQREMLARQMQARQGKTPGGLIVPPGGGGFRPPGRN